MPLVDKNPVFKHADSDWSWERFDRYAKYCLREGQPLGILMKDLICIDIQDKAVLQAWEAQFPTCLQSCPKESTKKGAHYIFKRTSKCDDYHMYTAPRTLSDGCTRFPVDVITRCATGTGGVLCVAPSPDKTGTQPLYVMNVPDLPDDLCEALIHSPLNPCSIQHRPQIPTPSITSGQTDIEYVFDKRMECIQKLDRQRHHAKGIRRELFQPLHAVL